MSALSALNDAISAAGQTIDALNAIVYFVFARDKNKLAEWKRAKRLELVRAHREKPTPTTP